MPDRSQHPPHAGGDGAPGIVVDHHFVVAVDSQAAEQGHEIGHRGQRMSAITRWCRQVAVQVDEDCARDVAVPVGLDPVVGVGQ